MKCLFQAMKEKNSLVIVIELSVWRPVMLICCDEVCTTGSFDGVGIIMLFGELERPWTIELTKRRSFEKCWMFVGEYVQIVGGVAVKTSSDDASGVEILFLTFSKLLNTEELLFWVKLVVNIGANKVGDTVRESVVMLTLWKSICSSISWIEEPDLAQAERLSKNEAIDRIAACCSPIIFMQSGESSEEIISITFIKLLSFEEESDICNDSMFYKMHKRFYD